MSVQQNFSDGFDVFDAQNKIMMCKFCNVRIEWERKDHVTTTEHVYAVNCIKGRKKKQARLVLVA